MRCTSVCISSCRAATTIGEAVLPRMSAEQRATLGALIERMSALTYEQVEQTHGRARVIAWFNFGGMVTHEAVLRSMRLFARTVVPAFA